jgi:hypothetical protein
MWKPIDEWDAMTTNKKGLLLRTKVVMFYFAGEKHPKHSYLDKAPVISESRVWGARRCTHFIILDHP